MKKLNKIIGFIKENKTLSIVIATAVIVLIMTVFGNDVLTPFNN